VICGIRETREGRIMRNIRKMFHIDNTLKPARGIVRSTLSLVSIFAVSIITTFYAIDAHSQGKSVYQTLLKNLQEGSRSIDFATLRLAYTETEDYNPYGQDDPIRSAMFAALKEKRNEDAITEAKKILNKNFVDLDSHYVCKVAYKRMNNNERYEFHDYVLQGLLSSILNSGDGKSPESALVVITTAEEYTVLGITGLRSKKQSLIHKNGRHYDRMEVMDPKTGDHFEIFFNIDIPFKWLNKRLKG